MRKKLFILFLEKILLGQLVTFDVAHATRSAAVVLSICVGVYDAIRRRVGVAPQSNVESFLFQAVKGQPGE